MSQTDWNPGSPQLRMGKEILEVITLIIVQNDLVQISGKNNVTIAFIDFPSVCHRKYHKLNINTMLLMILQNLYFNSH